MLLSQTKIPSKKKGQFKIILEMSCDVCEKKIEQKRAISYYLGKKYHFCSMKCLNVSQVKGGLVANRKIEVFQENYGCDNPLQSKIVKDKVIVTCNERYNVPWAAGSDFVKNKVQASLSSSYGVNSPSKCDDFAEKVTNTCLQRHNVAWTSKIPATRIQASKTLFQRYGVHCTADIPYVRAILSSQDVSKKRHETMKENCTYSTSKPENRLYEILCQNFNCIERQVRVNNSNIDFFIHDVNVYVQLDGVYWHGLDRPLEVIKQSINKRDIGIVQSFYRDIRQNVWFQESNLKLVRITDLELKKLPIISIIQRIKS